MHRQRVSRFVVAAVAAILLSSASGFAATRTQAIADCNAHGQLTQQYTLGQLRGALATMPPAIREYTNCFDVIQRQLDAQLGQAKPASGSSSGGSSDSFLPLPVIIILAVLVIATGGFTVMAVRRRGGGDGPPDS